MKNEEIQGLRGCGCTAVFLSHFIGALPFALQIDNVNLKYTIFGVFFNGTIAVYMFFILSGYFMYNSFDDNYDIKYYIKYIIKKVIQLYPIYIICILTGAIFATLYFKFNSGLLDNCFSLNFASSWKSEVSVKEVISHCIMISNFNSHFIDPPIWTMRMEMRMIIVLPFIYALLKKIENKHLIYYTIWISIIGISAFGVMGLGINTFDVMPYFMTGALLNYLIKHRITHLPKTEMNKVFILLICSAILCIIGLGQNYYIELQEVTSQYFVNWITTFCWFAILFLILKYPGSFTVLRSKILVFMGNISYSFYLSHYIILLSLRPVVLLFKEQQLVSYFTWGIISFVITIYISIKLERLRKQINIYFKLKNMEKTPYINHNHFGSIGINNRGVVNNGIKKNEER